MGKKTSNPKVSDRPPELFIVEQALALLAAIPSAQYPNESLGEVGKRRDKLKSDIRPIFPVLERLQAHFIPESVSPGPLACEWANSGTGTPITNLLKCFDLCVHCHEEAKRALSTVRLALLGEPFTRPFLPPEEREARLQRAARGASEEAERNRRSRAHMLRAFEDLKARLTRPKLEPTPPTVAQRTPGDGTEVPVLLPLERAVLDILVSQPPGRGILGKTVLKKLDGKGLTTSQSYLTSDIIPKLRELGISIPKSRGGRGYRIAGAMPPWVAKLPPASDRH